MKKAKNYVQTWAEINLSNLQHNLNSIRRLISTEVKILATVKANAYGHGIERISNFLSDKVDILGVASINEALTLKKQGIKTDILIMGNTLSEGWPLVVDKDIIASITDLRTANAINENAQNKNKKARVHIKVDTGMGRLGFWHEDAPDKIEQINKLSNIEIEGIFTHLSSAESNENFTFRQLDRFNEVIKKIEGKNIKVSFYHAANSVATLCYKQSHFNLIRPGLILYGVYPDIHVDRLLDVKPVLSLKSKIAYVKNVESGRFISYGREYVTDKKSKIATIPIGYADGYTYLLTHKARVLIKGEFCPVVGRICMDQIMADVTHIKDVNVEDEVTLLGICGKNRISAEELAKLAGTIPYEVLCWISQRVKRKYLP
jgi:alanine racemase